MKKRSLKYFLNNLKEVYDFKHIRRLVIKNSQDMSWSQFATTAQFYLYGRNHFTRTGWLRHKKKYPVPDILDDQKLSLHDRVYIVTGGTNGIGKEISTYLAQKKAIVYIFCRNFEKGKGICEEIAKIADNLNVFPIQCDCSLQVDIRRAWDEFCNSEKRRKSSSSVELYGLVCNAGALSSEKQLTSEHMEQTIATHLVYGVYLLGKLALSTLQATNNSRLIVVSSGGMYNTRFPSWDVATSQDSPNFIYDGQFAYAYAKRGQVLLCERWAEMFPSITVVSCHPGWTDTEGVSLAYGNQKKYLQPLRSIWEGSEGIIWLCVVDNSALVSGSFYLDRAVQCKHLSGFFFSEGTFTKNSREEVDDMILNLEKWTSLVPSLSLKSNPL